METSLNLSDFEEEIEELKQLEHSFELVLYNIAIY